jgi:heat shock protein HtpX
MFKRITLFLATNILVVLTVSLLLHVLGLDARLNAYGMDYTGLFMACLVWGFAGAFVSLALSRFMAKAFMGVRVIDPRQPGELGGLVDIVHSLAQKAGLPAMPEVGIYDSMDVNAFATGPTRSRALVAVSSGLLQRMNRDEIEGVLGHEVTHIANGDMVTMTLLQGVVNAFVMFLARILAMALSRGSRENGGRGTSYMLVFALEMLLSFFGMLIVAGFSRYREYRADHGGAQVAGREKMIGALQALNRFYGRGAAAQKDHPAVATLKISGHRRGVMALWSTHPPLEDRIARLQATP